MTDVYDPDRDDALPGNATPLERAIAQTEGRLDDVDMDLIRKVGSSDIAEVPEPYLLHRAWGRSVDVYDPRWPEDVRRAVIVASPLVHLFKGTPFAVRAALGALGVDAEIVQWWETTPKGRPYTFEVQAFARARLYDGPFLDPRLIRVIHATIDRTAADARAFDLRVVASMGTPVALSPAFSVRGHVRASLRPDPHEVFASGLGLAPAFTVRGHVRAALHPAAREVFGAVLGLACAFAVRGRVALTLNARLDP